VIPLLGTLRRTYVDEFLDAIKLSIPADALECHSVACLKAIVMQTDYVGILPSQTTTLEERAGLIAKVPVKGRPTVRAIGIWHRARYPLTEAAVATMREIQYVCRRLGSKRSPYN
jgi:DNA-binding transcriptional LysR family regulator